MGEPLTGGGRNDLLATVQTLPVGSAKVPRFGVIAKVVRAADESAAMRAVAAVERNIAALDGPAPAPKGGARITSTPTSSRSSDCRTARPSRFAPCPLRL